MQLMKRVKLKDETHARLADLGKYGQTMDEIINKCIDAYLKGASPKK